MNLQGIPRPIGSPQKPIATAMRHCVMEEMVCTNPGREGRRAYLWQTSAVGIPSSELYTTYRVCSRHPATSKHVT